MVPLASFQLFDPVGQVLIAGQQLAEPDEGAHDENIHLYRAFAFEHRGQHGQVGVEHDLLAADKIDPALDQFDGHGQLGKGWDLIFRHRSFTLQSFTVTGAAP
jgi:hypothetical protein